MNPNHEILVDYLDGTLGSEAAAGIKNQVKQDPETAANLAYLELALDTVRQDALRQRVAAVRSSFEAGRSASQKNSGTVVRSMYRTSLRIAATVILVAGLSLMYKYFTVSSGSVFEKQSTGYDPGTARSQDAKDAVAESYQQKNWKQVIANYEAETNPSIKSRFLAAMADMEENRFPQAISIFENILDTNRKNGTDSFQDETEYYLSLAYLKNREVEKAVSLIRKIKADPAHRYYPAASKISSTDLKIIQLKK